MFGSDVESEALEKWVMEEEFACEPFWQAIKKPLGW